MHTWQKLVSLLSDGGYHSGEDIGHSLGVSRAAVWKQCKKLKDMGLDVESCHKRGYRIPGGVSLLDPATIRQMMGAESREALLDLQVFPSVGSTNEVAMERALAGGAEGYVCLAEFQTAGKGRRGRSWASPFGANIYLSLVNRFQGGVAAVEGLSLAVGVALVRALRHLDFQGVELKWPNDLQYQGRKLGGVLLEIAGDPAGACDVIIGIGLNVAMPRTAATAIDQPWIDLRTIAGCAIERNAVAAAMLDQLLPLVASYELEGFARYKDEWESVDALLGKRVQLQLGEISRAGIARGVDRTGAICIETESGLDVYSGGEVSLRATP